MFNIEDIKNKIICGDALEVLKQFPDNCIDTVITDPPYGLSDHSERLIREILSKWLSGEEDYVPSKKGFMNQDWDAFVPPPALWKEVYRVMKPGGTILCFAGSRTQDLMTISLRLAGFEIKDTILWLYGQGFPKSTDISKQIDKKFGKEREVIGKGISGKTAIWQKDGGMGNFDITLPATPETKLWEGYGTALKPAYEPIILAIKPNEGSYAENALKWGVAGLNIDGGRIPFENTSNPATNPKYRLEAGYKLPARGQKSEGAVNFTSSKNQTNIKGRFPANVILDEEAAHMLDEQSGIRKSGGGKKGIMGEIFGNKKDNPNRENSLYFDIGGASRFFYCAKASRNERNIGGADNKHPTVKPLALIEYLVKLTSMPNLDQIYLDPFLGSGTTAMACEKLNRNWIGIEKEEEYCLIAQKRIEKFRKENNSLFQQDFSPPEIIYLN